MSTFSFPVPQLVVRSVPLGQRPELLAVLRQAATAAWLQGSSGLVGCGVAAVFRAPAVGGLVAARRWWADVVAAAQVTDQVQSPGSGLMAFGSFRFVECAGQSAGLLIVPQVVYGCVGGRFWRTEISVGAAPADTVAAVAAAAPVGRGVAGGPAELEFVAGALSVAQWQDRVGHVRDRLQAGELAKVVLARDEVVSLPQPVDIPGVLTELTTQYPACWTFHVAGLLGATPEMLVRKTGTQVLSRVLAGTLPRTSKADDAAVLRRSGKDLAEHQVAVDSVTGALAPLVESWSAPSEPSPLELANVTHLATDVQATVAAQVDVLSLVAALHPTAAVCGTPTAAALAVIAQVEAMDRGRYAGPVGWLDAAGHGEFGLALRCAQVADDDPAQVRLFAGCGIMANSAPSAEVAESVAKLAPMKAALRATQSVAR